MGGTVASRPPRPSPLPLYPPLWARCIGLSRPLVSVITRWIRFQVREEACQPLSSRVFVSLLCRVQLVDSATSFEILDAIERVGRGTDAKSLSREEVGIRQDGRTAFMRVKYTLTPKIIWGSRDFASERESSPIRDGNWNRSSVDAENCVLSRKTLLSDSERETFAGDISEERRKIPAKWDFRGNWEIFEESDISAILFCLQRISEFS